MSMRIEPIGAVGTSPSVAAVSMRRKRSHAYQVENQSQVSDVYRKNPLAGSQSQVEPVRPVGYANASWQAARARKAEDNLSTSSAYNRIADSYSGTNTGYTADMAGTSYSMVGANFDRYI